MHAAAAALVLVRLRPGQRRSPGLRIGAPDDDRVTVYLRGKLQRLPRAQVSRARTPSSAPVAYGRLLAEYERVRHLMASLRPRAPRR